MGLAKTYPRKKGKICHFGNLKIPLDYDCLRRSTFQHNHPQIPLPSNRVSAPPLFCLLTNSSLDGVLFITIGRYRNFFQGTCRYQIIVYNKRALSVLLILCSKTVIAVVLLLTASNFTNHFWLFLFLCPFTLHSDVNVCV